MMIKMLGLSEKNYLAGKLDLADRGRADPGSPERLVDRSRTSRVGVVPTGGA